MTTPQANSFLGTNMYVGNRACRSLIADIMDLRTQVTRTNEIRAIGGWGDPLNEFLAERMDAIRATLALQVRDLRAAPDTDSGSVEASDSQAERNELMESEARDETLRMRDSYDLNKPITADDTQMPPGNTFQLPYDFSGANPDYPQVQIEPAFQNVWLKNFVIALDDVVRNASIIACAGFGHTIPADQATTLLAGLESAFAILQQKGGEKNRARVIAPTDANDLTGKVGAEAVPSVVGTPVPQPAG